MKANKVQIGRSFLSELGEWRGGGGFTLAKTQQILNRLDNPQDSLPLVHVAGTNGKGSTSAAMAAVLGASGFRTGLTISPHLQNVNERIVIDGLSIDDTALGEFAHDVRNAAAKENVSISYHEAFTVLAFLAFRELGAEWGVVEVGLGGRLDATNVIKRPAITAIVSIGLDHQDILGATYAEIAREKGGIAKAGVPLVVGPLPKEASKAIRDLCAEKNVTLSEFGRHFQSSPLERLDKGRFRALYTGPDRAFAFDIALPGKHQVENMAVVIEMARLVGLTEEATKAGISSVFWPGRLEWTVWEGTSLLFDCAHNVEGIDALISFLDSVGISSIDVVFGVVSGKNWPEMVRRLSPRVRSWSLLRPDSIRAVETESIEAQLRELTSGSDVKIESFGSNYEEVSRRLLQRDPATLCCIVGSMYMVGKLRHVLGIATPKLWTRK